MAKNSSWLTACLLVALTGTADAALVPQSLLESCFRAQSKVTPFAGALLVSQGKDVFVRTVGTIDGSKPIERDTRFRLASVGKTLTRVAIGQLVARSRIDLDAPIRRYLPGLSSELGQVTVEQLVQHRSGVAPLLMFTDQFLAVVKSAHTAHDLLPLVVKEPLQFKPGEREQYSNGGYFLLGAIIEAVTKKS
jgi:D-alanyl-D-alanine carboxypeptidase